MNIWNELKKEVGYVDVTNQYIELAKRYYEKECVEKDLQISARQVGLNISQLPESYEVRISKGYIVNIHSCIERFLLAFKDLPGSPTKKNEYKPEKDKNRLQWTLKHCYGSIDGDVGELYNVCNYYRLVRNKIVHGGSEDTELRVAYNNVIHISEGLLLSRMCCKLEAPKRINELGFDDQVLFSRSVLKLCERIYKDSQYNWLKVIESNRETIKRIISRDRSCERRSTNKIIKFLKQMYPIKEADIQELIDIIQQIEW